MERRVAVIVRWLERCTKAYRTGSLESALMDAECARADIDRLRDEVWTKLERRYRSHLRSRAFFRGTVIAAITVLAAAAPLAVVQEKPAPRPYTRQAREAENISEPSAAERMAPDEKKPLPGLRSPQSGRDVSVREAGRTPRLEPARASEKSGGNRAEKRDPNETVTREKFLSLLKTGERALKNEEPVIKIEK